MTMSQGENLVLLTTCYDFMQAHMIRGVLESNEIACFIFDDHHGAIAPHINIALGGVRVMVMGKDIETAKILLKDEEPPRESATVTNHQPWLKKPYLRTILLGFIGLMIGAPADRPQTKPEKEASDDTKQ